MWSFYPSRAISWYERFSNSQTRASWRQSPTICTDMWVLHGPLWLLSFRRAPKQHLEVQFSTHSGSGLWGRVTSSSPSTARGSRDQEDEENKPTKTLNKWREGNLQREGDSLSLFQNKEFKLKEKAAEVYSHRTDIKWKKKKIAPKRRLYKRRLRT